MRRDKQDDDSGLVLLAVGVFVLVLVIAAVVVGTTILPQIIDIGSVSSKLIDFC